MKYSEAVDYLDGKVVLGVKPSLDRILKLCQLLGYPQGSYDAIQVAGTNGKTSVAHMTAAILQECGYRVGLYTSPHLETVRERIKVNGKLISFGKFAEILSGLVPTIEKAESELDEPLTYFEVVTAIAYVYFKESDVRVAVLEAGMGGRWDATNVVESDVAVITNIGIDHVNELGRTRQRIAGEKIGVINEGATVVTAEADREILLMISEKCHEVGAELKVFGRDFRLDFHVPYRVPGEQPSQFISVRGLDGMLFEDVKLPLIGKHQAVNAACAIAAAQSYTDPRERTHREEFKRALEGCRVAGRLDVLSKRPLVVTDGAHNLLGMEKLAGALMSEFEYDRLVVVIGAMKDKDARGMLRVLGAIADTVIVTESRSSRSFAAKRLGNFCRTERIEHRVEPDFHRAMKLAYNIAGENGMVCVTGSLYMVAEARIFLRHQKASREMRQDR